jgi:hypothetical protein
MQIENLIGRAAEFAAGLKGFDPSSPDAVGKLGESRLRALVLAADELKTQSGVLLLRLKQEQEKIHQELIARRKEQESLESGKYHFPSYVTDLRDAIAGRLRNKTGKSVEVLIVAEAAEVQNSRWVNAIEGYLNTQKFYLIVPPEHFTAALHVYDAIKRERSIYGTGIVDIEKIENLNPKAEPGSLACEISADNHYVRLFLDYTLGRVMKCDKVGELRRHTTAITDEGMLYRNFVVRAMNPGLWAKPAIGQGAILRRLGDVRKEIAGLEGQAGFIRSRETPVQGLSAITIPGESEPARLISAAFTVRRIPGLEEEIAELRKNLAAVDKSGIEALNKRIVATRSS